MSTSINGRVPTIVVGASLKRTKSKAAHAEIAARQFVIDRGRMPTLSELRLASGGGSERDLVQARREVQPVLEAMLAEQAARTAALLRANIEREVRDQLPQVRLTANLSEAENAASLAEAEGTITRLSDDLQQLKAQLSGLQAQLDIERHERLAEAERFEGMRVHLLLETARIRDELAKPAFVPLPGLRFERLPGEESQDVFERN